MILADGEHGVYHCAEEGLEHFTSCKVWINFAFAHSRDQSA